MFKNKKGSMELSVNSIVILVIAIVIMGLILGFIRAKFSTIGNDLVGKEPDAPPASATMPVTFSSDMKIITAGDTAIIKVNVYNPTNAPVANTIASLVANCNPGAPAGLTISPSKVSQNIPAYGYSSYTIAVSTLKSATKQTAICTLTNSNVAIGASGDYTIKIV